MWSTHSIFSLPLTSPGAIAVTNGLYADPAIHQIIGDVGCIGTEPGLLGCNHTLFGTGQPANCDPTVGDAAAVCQGEGWYEQGQ